MYGLNGLARMFNGVVPHELRQYAAVSLTVAQRLAMHKVLRKLILQFLGFHALPATA